MTNYEYYKKEIDNITKMGRAVAFDITTNKVCCCTGTEYCCNNCLFRLLDDDSDGWFANCNALAVEWANKEYEETVQNVDWSKVKVDTRIYYRENKSSDWIPGHFAKYENGKVYAWKNGRTSFSS